VEELSTEIQGQKDLLAAENGDLAIHCKPVRSLAVLRKAVSSHEELEIAREKTIQIEPSSADVELSADQTQLLRLLGNMLKNALEATPAGERVVAGCELSQDSRVSFWVRNFQFMPPAVQHQVFNRSYSTKGKGRGLGTYSMKLICERYLGGKVSFTTSEEQGTIFKAVLPLVFNKA
jgi:signal transduction histidine kinase